MLQSITDFIAVAVDKVSKSRMLSDKMVVFWSIAGDCIDLDLGTLCYRLITKMEIEDGELDTNLVDVRLEAIRFGISPYDLDKFVHLKPRLRGSVEPRGYYFNKPTQAPPVNFETADEAVARRAVAQQAQAGPYAANPRVVGYDPPANAADFMRSSQAVREQAVLGTADSNVNVMADDPYPRRRELVESTERLLKDITGDGRFTALTDSGSLFARMVNINRLLGEILAARQKPAEPLAAEPRQPMPAGDRWS